ncbi:MAG: 3-methyl-2-oxobutanoate hydroxymethyltransferase [Actinomycetota bacterium]
MSVHQRNARVTVRSVQGFKDRGERFPMLTCYDALSARILEEAGIPLLLVGDSLGMVMLGYDSTVPVTMEEMLHHTRAVSRGAATAMVIGDMPFMSFQGDPDEAVANAGRFLKEAGAHAVKLEGGGRIIEVVERMTSSGIPVMAHLGLTPQSVNQMGGFRVQGRTEEQAHRIAEDAKNLEAAGAFSLVLEGVPSDLAKQVTESLTIPTIGIGAGPHCDGQVLVYHDFLGITPGTKPKFVKEYAQLGEAIGEAARAYAEEVRRGVHPDLEHSYS